MKAVALSRFGGPEVLQLRELPDPVPGANEVLIAVAFAGVNPADWKDREGMTAAFMGAQFPYTPGFDAAGIVAGVGSAVTRFTVGDRVFTPSDHGQGRPGSYAELVIASESSVAHVPGGLSLKTAAALPVAGLTAWQALFAPDKGALSHNVALAPGEAALPVILVNGGAGGLGSFAVQFARWAGYRVVATCGPDNLQYVRQLGAECAVNYRDNNVADALLNDYPDGVDLLLDAVGCSSLESPLTLVKHGGTLVSIPTLIDDGDVEQSMTDAASAGKRKVFAFMHDRDVSDTLEKIAALITSGAIAAPPVTCFALEDVALAHARLQDGHVRGKLVLAVRGEPDPAL